MSLLRFASLIVLSVWIGGLATLGFVAGPATFTSLEALEGDRGRVLAGRVFGDVLAHFDTVAWMLGGLLLVLLIVRAVLGPRPRRFAWRVGAATIMLALSLTAGLWVAPRIEAIRDGTSGAVATLPETDPRRAEFGRLHGLASGLALLTIAGGLWLLWMETHDGGQ